MTFDERLEILREDEWDEARDEGEIRLARISGELLDEIVGMTPVPAALTLRHVLAEPEANQTRTGL